MGNPALNGTVSPLQKIIRAIIGAPKHLKDPHLFHKMSLIPVLAWVGLGADGLSSSAYGPEEAFRALGEHRYLALLLALATALTVFIISYAYSRIIEHFPHGGGGYIVASHILGEKAGVVSGSALLVDYVMTITISIASCCDAVFSYVPQSVHHYKVPVACLLAVVLIIDLEKYVGLARKLGFAADYRMALATDVVESVVEIPDPQPDSQAGLGDRLPGTAPRAAGQHQQPAPQDRG